MLRIFAISSHIYGTGGNTALEQTLEAFLGSDLGATKFFFR